MVSFPIYPTKGFSFFELILVLSIVAILAAMSFPLLGKYQQHAQQKILSTQLLRAIQLTRSEAIMRQEKVVLCKSADQKTCSGDWQDGFIVTIASQMLYTFAPHLDGKLFWRAFPKYLDHLEFLSSGLTNAQNGTFWYCAGGEKNPAWAIMLSQAAGRARMVYPDQRGEILDDAGEVLVC